VMNKRSIALARDVDKCASGGYRDRVGQTGLVACPKRHLFLANMLAMNEV